MTDLEYRIPSPHYLRLTLEDRALCLTSPDDPILTSTKLCVKPSPSGILDIRTLKILEQLKYFSNCFSLRIYEYTVKLESK